MQHLPQTQPFAGPSSHNFGGPQPPPPPPPHHHHHHIHVHSHHQGQQSSSSQLGLSPSPAMRDGSGDKKRTRPTNEDSHAIPSEDRNEWYYPAAPQPVTSAEDDEGAMQPGSRTGNWGNKRLKGARWAKRGKVAAWGPRWAEWELEDRVRKRLKSILPPSESAPSSPPLPVLPHLRSPTPPLTAPYVLPAATHPTYTSYVLDPSVQHTFRSNNTPELEKTGTELIEGEGALRMAIGALMREIDGDIVLSDPADSTRRRRHSTVDSKGSSGGRDNDDTMDDDDSTANDLNGLKNGEDVIHQRQNNMQQLFLSPHPIQIGPEGNVTMLSTQSQIESLEWCLNVIRDLADDGQEYHTRLEEIQEGLGLSRAIRKEVWTIARQKALEEMEEEDESGEGGSETE